MRLKTKFQDEDFGLGEVVEANIYYGGNGRVKVIAESAKSGDNTFYFETLKEMNEMFEDAPEPKMFYWIDYDGKICKAEIGTMDRAKIKQIGNYFETEEEAKKARKKIKAWKRLKGHNLRIERGQRMFVNADNKLTSQETLFVVDTYGEVEDDLDLLFGGEE